MPKNPGVDPVIWHGLIRAGEQNAGNRGGGTKKDALAAMRGTAHPLVMTYVVFAERMAVKTLEIGAVNASLKPAVHRGRRHPQQQASQQTHRQRSFLRGTQLPWRLLDYFFGILGEIARRRDLSQHPGHD